MIKLILDTYKYTYTHAPPVRGLAAVFHFPMYTSVLFISVTGVLSISEQGCLVRGG